MPAATSFSTDRFVISSFALAMQLAARRVDDVVREDLALEVLVGTSSSLTFACSSSRTCLIVMRRSFSTIDLAADLDVEARRLAAQALGHRA